MTQPITRSLRLLLGITSLSMVLGALFGLATSDGNPLGALRGVVTGFAISCPLSCLEIYGMNGPIGPPLRRLSFARLLLAKTLIYLVVILIGVQIGILAAPIGGSHAVRLDRDLFSAILFSLALAIIFNFVIQIDSMLGQGELARFLLGRYHRPHQEERIFLFLDLVGSTSLAERLGGVRFFELLNRIHTDIAGPIVEHRGEIHKYVGDEAIVTWIPRIGLPQARCVACALAIEAKLDALAETYRARFGIAPRFRFGLHLGTVVSGELGSVKQEIAYLGDPVNTTARLIDACRELDRRFIASGTLLERLELPAMVAAEALGPVRLRGKETVLPLFALSAAPAA